MWKIYSGQGLAVQSTFQRLCDSFTEPDQHVFAGIVKYADFLVQPMEFGNWTGPVMYKRKMFEYEQEVRAVWLFPPMKDGKIDLNVEPKGIGKRLQVDLRVLIEAVYLAPGRQAWFKQLVRSILDRYGYVDIPLRPSALDDVPHTGTSKDFRLKEERAQLEEGTVARTVVDIHESHQFDQLEQRILDVGASSPMAAFLQLHARIEWELRAFGSRLGIPRNEVWNVPLAIKMLMGRNEHLDRVLGALESNTELYNQIVYADEADRLDDREILASIQVGLKFPRLIRDTFRYEQRAPPEQPAAPEADRSDIGLGPSSPEV
jgi:hypothetical protein